MLTPAPPPPSLITKVCGLLSHEAKLSVVNYAIHKAAGFTPKLTSKEELLFVTGRRGQTLALTLLFVTGR